jgi:hypothetical protein
LGHAFGRLPRVRFGGNLTEGLGVSLLNVFIQAAVSKCKIALVR